MVVHACGPNFWRAEIGGSFESFCAFGISLGTMGSLWLKTNQKTKVVGTTEKVYSYEYADTLQKMRSKDIIYSNIHENKILRNNYNKICIKCLHTICKH